MVALLLLTLAQIPTPAPVLPAPAAPAQVAPPKPRPAAPTTVTLTLTVTDAAGAPLDDVTVTATGPVDREAKTPVGGILRIQGLRAGAYRVRFSRVGYYTFEKEIVWRVGMPAPEATVTLNAAPPPPPSPPPLPPATPAAAVVVEPRLSPPGTPKTMVLPDFIENNFIPSRDAHKENIVGCSGVSQAILWQVRDPWEGRQHPSADAMLYVIGGEGTLKLAGSDVTVMAGSFAVVPRGTMYGFVRRGRNPLIVLAVLSGPPCAVN